MAASPINLTITADISPLVQELQGRGIQVLQQFGKDTGIVFKDIAAVTVVTTTALVKFAEAAKNACGDVESSLVSVEHAFELVEHGAKKFIEVAGGLVIMTKSAVMFYTAHQRMKEFGETLLNTARAVEIYESALAIVPISLAIMTEKSIGLALAQNKLNKEFALTAAQQKKSFEEVATLATMGTMAGNKDVETVFQKMAVQDIPALIDEFQKLKDPVEKAKFAVDHFGDNAAKALPLLDERMKANANRAYELAVALDPHVRESLDKLSETIHHPLTWLQILADAWRDFKLSAKETVALTVVKAGDLGKGEPPDPGAEWMKKQGVGFSQAPYKATPSYLEIAKSWDEAKKSVDATNAAAEKYTDILNKGAGVSKSLLGLSDAAISKDANSLENLSRKLSELKEKLKGEEVILPSMTGGPGEGAVRSLIVQDQKAVEALSAKIKGMEGAAEEVKKQAERTLEIRTQEIEVTKTLAQEEATSKESNIKALYDMGVISAERELELLRTNENKRFLAEADANLALQELAKSRGKEGEVELSRAQGALQELTKQHLDKIVAINLEGAKQVKEVNKSIAEGAIADETAISEARIARAQETTKALAAANKITPVQEMVQSTVQESGLYVAKKTELEKELSLIDANDDKQKEKFQHLNDELELLEIHHQTELDKIRSSGSAKELQKEVQDSQRILAETITRDDFVLKTEQDTNAQRLKNHQETQNQWLKDEITTLDKWYAAQKEAYKKAEADMAAMKGIDSAEYKNLIEREEALDQDWALKRKKLVDQMNQQYKQLMNQFQQESNNAITSALMGTEKWSKAWTQVYNSMMSSLIQFGLKWVEQWAINELKTLVLTKTTTATNSLTQITAAAAVAAANAAAAVAGIPIVGPALAATVGPATYAEVMAYAAMAQFETGGLVPKTGMIMAHEKEGVLPARLTNMLMGVANSGQGTGRDMKMSAPGGNTTINYTQHINAAQGISAKEIGAHSVAALTSYVRRMNLRPA